MFVKLQNQPDIHQCLLAWKNSRPTEQNAYYDRMIDLDLPVNEFTSVNLFIESTLIERDIIATMRNHVMWAQGSRVQDCLEFEIDYKSNPNLKEYEHYYEMMRREMKIDAGNGVRQDEYRLRLPLISNTRYSISTSFRGLLKISKYFLYLSNELPLFKEQFRKFSSQLMSVVDSILPYSVAERDFPSVKPYMILNEQPIEHSEYSTNANGMVVVASKIPFHLRAHVVRHRGISFKDELFDLLKNENVFKFDMSYPVTVMIAGTKDDMAEVVSKRTCWVANYKVWSSLLTKIGNEIGVDDSLPCKTGVCPWDADARLRYEGNDPNPPCPIHLKLNNLIPTTEQLFKMQEMIEADNRPVKFWSTKIEELSND